MSDTKMRIIDIKAALVQQAFPTITLWNRLEGRPRAADFDRALRAEVRDALWMLTKQWQLGEFRGDDAGSPVTARIHVTSSPLTRYKAARGLAQHLDDSLPLEAVVEQRPIPFHVGDQPLSLDLRLAMGRQWLRLANKVGSFAQAYIGRYPIAMPDPEDEADAWICAHPATWAQFAAVAGRAMDGAALWDYLRSDPTHHAYDGIPVPAHQRGEIDQAAVKFIRWFKSLFTQPADGEGGAWMPARLEYQFACSAPEGDGDKVYTADEYYHGHLDWYNLDLDPKRASLGAVSGAQPAALPPPLTQSFIPAPISFEGMPNTRWWTFEDSRTNFGDIKPDTTDIAKLLLIEFGLVYANDWFLFPMTLPTGSIARVKGLTVTNVFGERTWIEPSGSGPDQAWQRWSMFTTSIKGKADVPAEMSILLLPTVPKIQESNPLEEVMLVRDEVANMVWGIETTVPLADGTRSGSEAGGELFAALQRLIDAGIAAGTLPKTTVAYKAPIRYRIMNTVPENWIPFIPVHVAGDNRETQLQRAAMPRILEGDPDPPKKVRPRTVLLREGLDRTPPEAYYLHEEEVPRAGVRVACSFQRTRWRDGRVVVWLGVHKGIGRGEGSSGLAFDQIVPTD